MSGAVKQDGVHHCLLALGVCLASQFPNQIDSKSMGCQPHGKVVRQCPQTDGCLDLYHPPCPTRQLLVYIHSQLVPTSPTELGVKLPSPKQRCMLLPKVEKLLVDVAVACGKAITQPIKTPYCFAQFMFVASVALLCGPPSFHMQTPKTWTKQTRGFPAWST